MTPLKWDKAPPMTGGTERAADVFLAAERWLSATEAAKLAKCSRPVAGMVANTLAHAGLLEMAETHDVSRLGERFIRKGGSLPKAYRRVGAEPYAKEAIGPRASLYARRRP